MEGFDSPPRLALSLEIEMASTFGTIVQVQTIEDYEKMMAHPEALSGWFDSSSSHGEITFTSQPAAQRARREV